MRRHDSKKDKIDYILERTEYFKNDISKFKDVPNWDTEKLDKCIYLIKQIDAKKAIRDRGKSNVRK